MAGRPSLDTSNLVGQKHNHLTITEHLGIINGIRMVMAVCDCGSEEKEYRLFNIIGNGKTKSCGCYNKEVTAERNKNFATHGLTGHPLLSVWYGMISRCYDSTDVCFKNYGAKGVIICEEWRNDPKVFYDWAINNGWQQGLHLDKDKLSPYQTGKIYSSEFCCFLTPKENAAHKSNSIMLEYNNEIRSLGEWATILNLPHALLQNRYQMGWEAKDIFELPVKKAQLFEYKNEKRTLIELAELHGFQYKTVYNRVNYLGWDLEKALNTPLVPPNQSGFHKKYLNK